MNLNNVQSFPNGSGAAVVAYRWMAFDTDGNLVYGDKDTANVRLAGAALQDRGATDLDPIDISLFNCGGVHYGTAGAAIAAGAEIQLGDDGKIVTKATLAARGIAMQAASGDGAIIRVYVYPAAAPTRGEGAIPSQTQTALTDSSTGAASTTLAAVVNAVAAGTDTTAASLTSTNAALGVLKNAVASLAAELALVKADVASILTYLA